jgi:hypothetical protein
MVQYAMAAGLPETLWCSSRVSDCHRECLGSHVMIVSATRSCRKWQLSGSRRGTVLMCSVARLLHLVNPARIRSGHLS